MKILTGKEQKNVKNQFKTVLKQEQKFLAYQPNELIAEKMCKIEKNLQQKIPEKVTTSLQQVFAKSFQLLFEKGSNLIYKTYRTSKIQHTQQLHQKLERFFSKKELFYLQKEVTSCVLFHQGVTAIEGAGLGLLGIGLPDIPIFLAMVLRNIYQIGQIYGFQIDNNAEKYMVLSIICTAVTTKAQRERFSALTDRVAYQVSLSKSDIDDMKLQQMIETTSQKICTRLLFAKAVQGMPIIGVTGGVVNFAMMNDIRKAATYKYQKRFLSQYLS